MFDLEASLEATERQNAEGCVKTVEDLERYRRIIAEVKPGLVIETGTYTGHSALWFADEAGARVVTIDTADQVSPETKAAWSGRVRQVIAESTSMTAVTAVISEWTTFIGWDEQNPQRHVMVVLDSDHSFRTVYDEMSSYGPYVTPGSYMIVEDTILHWMSTEERAVYGNTDPLDAVERWMSIAPPADTPWELDEEIQNLSPVTMHPYGWLRRKS